MKVEITSCFKSVAIAAVLLWLLTIAGDATIRTVTNANDSGPDALRQALAVTNDGDTITFAVTGQLGNYR